PGPFSLRAVVEALRVQFDGNAAGKSLDFKVDVLPTLPDRLYGDSAKLAQCLECLLDNAIKFTRVGGLALRVTGRPAGDNRMALSFAVIDTGIGFTDLGEATMYQRFFQLDGSMTREYGGLGVGLAICRQLVELLGGKLTHRSEPARGSRFQLDVEFELPVVEPAPTAANARTSMREPQDCTVLLVDDNSVNQLVLRGMLLKLGFRVRSVDSGAAAIGCLQRETYDAVLIDCHLPGLDGASLGCQIRDLPGCADLPVLMLVPSAEREYGATGALIDYLNKPVKFEDLQTMLLRRVLGFTQGESAAN
ncbi:response regulator, partial [Pseudomonas syringae]|nr:response regulator [Pseudomonas syringae]